MYNNYIIKESDTLDSIAKKFRIPYSELIRNNKLEDVFELSVGQELKISNHRQMMFQLYKVKSGDTIHGIARKFGIDMNMLLGINGLSNQSLIYPYQDLLVPGENVNLYITKPEDKLDRVLHNTNLSVEELLMYNENVYLLPNQVIAYRNQG